MGERLHLLAARAHVREVIRQSLSLGNCGSREGCEGSEGIQNMGTLERIDRFIMR